MTTPTPPSDEQRPGPPGRWTFLAALGVVLLMSATALALTVAIFH